MNATYNITICRDASAVYIILQSLCYSFDNQQTYIYVHVQICSCLQQYSQDQKELIASPVCKITVGINVYIKLKLMAMQLFNTVHCIQNQYSMAILYKDLRILKYGLFTYMYYSSQQAYMSCFNVSIVGASLIIIILNIPLYYTAELHVIKRTPLHEAMFAW